MTATDKPVVRITRGEYRVLRVQPARIIVRVGPGDVLSFRAARGRQWYSLPIASVFRSAIEAAARSDFSR